MNGAELAHLSDRDLLVRVATKVELVSKAIDDLREANWSQDERIKSNRENIVRLSAIGGTLWIVTVTLTGLAIALLGKIV